MYCPFPSSLSQPDFCAKKDFTLLSFHSFSTPHSFQLHTLSTITILCAISGYPRTIHSLYKQKKQKQASSELISSHHHRYSLCRRKSQQDNISRTQHYPSDNQPRQASQPRTTTSETKHLTHKDSSQDLPRTNRSPSSNIHHRIAQYHRDCANPLLQSARSKDSPTTHIKHSAPPNLSRASKTTMRQPLSLSLLR